MQNIEKANAVILNRHVILYLIVNKIFFFTTLLHSLNPLSLRLLNLLSAQLAIYALF
jgi:hypothetical protein